MLALTDTASNVIKALTERTAAPEGAGLYIAMTPDGTEGLTVSMASMPQQGNEVVESDGARVFLEPTAASMLEEQVLDARVDEDGRVEFMLAPR
jgi:iron-sulfur cluster assembly protein